MTDSWERRPVPHSRGHNNLAPTIDAAIVDDVLTITASESYFGQVGNIVGAGDSPDGTPGWTFTIGPGDYTVVSDTEIELSGAWAALINVPGDDGRIRQLDLYDNAGRLLTIWIGSILVEEPGEAVTGYMESVTYNAGTDELRIDFTPAYDALGVNANPERFIFNQGTGVEVTLNAFTGTYTIESDGEIYVLLANASTHLAPNTTIYDIEMFNETSPPTGLTSVGTWSGEIALS